MRTSNSGKVIATFCIVTNDRKKNQDTGEFEDSNVSFWNIVAFGSLAENVIESLTKGTATIVVGKAMQEEYTKDGETKKAWKVIADDAGPSVRFATAKVAGSDAGLRRSAAVDEPPF